MIITQTMIDEQDAKLNASIADLGATALAIKAQRDEAMAVLRELVECKQMKDDLDGGPGSFASPTAYRNCHAEYVKRKLEAWAKAFALVEKESKQ